MAFPLTLSGPSMRGVFRPIGDVIAFFSVVGVLGIR
jgi:hypothetical protein